MSLTSLDAALWLAFAWLAIGGAGFLAPRNFVYIARVLFPLGALVGILLAGVALVALFQDPVSKVLPLGLPDLPFHARMDALSAFFLLLTGSVAAGISVFAGGYFRHAEEVELPGLVCFYYHVFLASMALVLVADDAYFFMVAWESMALSSFFLVTTDHRHAEIRRAGYLYLLIAHVGAMAILMCFGALQGGTGSYSFDTMRAVQPEPVWGTVAFLLALFGFGAKAGLLPLHVWLPEAHPAAPSPVSALMSAVMLKTAIYGLLRVTFDLIGTPIWWWGVIALSIGLASALFGIVFAAVQTDMKRLLAYSSIENIGLIVSGFGLTILFRGFSMGPLAALALTATLYHCINHAFFKSLLFLATGSVLHSTKERSLGKLGGLIHRMPWVAWLALVGTLAIAGLPPLNGFVSEWLLLQAFLFTPGLPHAYLNMLVPVAAGLIAFTAALSGYVMVKFYGVVFLGQPREPKLAETQDAGLWKRAGLMWLAAGCVTLGLFPLTVIGLIDEVTRPLTGFGIAGQSAARGWLFLVPISAERASYSPLLFLLMTALVLAVVWLCVRLFYHGRMRRGAPWDCGFPYLDSRMQDTAQGFGQPVRQVFEQYFRIEQTLPSPFDAKPRYAETLGDPIWHWLYLPFVRGIVRATGLITVLQRGRISVYLIYSFVTLLALLLFVR